MSKKIKLSYEELHLELTKYFHIGYTDGLIDGEELGFESGYNECLNQIEELKEFSIPTSHTGKILVRAHHDEPSYMNTGWKWVNEEEVSLPFDMTTRSVILPVKKEKTVAELAEFLINDYWVENEYELTTKEHFQKDAERLHKFIYGNEN